MLVYRIRSIILNNAKLKWVNDLITQKWNELLYTYIKNRLLLDESP